MATMYFKIDVQAIKCGLKIIALNLVNEKLFTKTFFLNFSKKLSKENAFGSFGG